MDRSSLGRYDQRWEATAPGGNLVSAPHSPLPSEFARGADQRQRQGRCDGADPSPPFLSPHPPGPSLSQSCRVPTLLVRTVAQAGKAQEPLRSRPQEPLTNPQPTDRGPTAIIVRRLPTRIRIYPILPWLLPIFYCSSTLRRRRPVTSPRHPVRYVPSSHPSPSLILQRSTTPPPCRGHSASSECRCPSFIPSPSSIRPASAFAPHDWETHLGSERLTLRVWTLRTWIV
jgi:hypothetical protein